VAKRDKWCMVCGAAPSEPCTYTSTVHDEHHDQTAGEVRDGDHWARGQDKEPAVLLRNEPSWTP
jgi:hypothetical protein